MPDRQHDDQHQALEDALRDHLFLHRLDQHRAVESKIASALLHVALLRPLPAQIDASRPAQHNADPQQLCDREGVDCEEQAAEEHDYGRNEAGWEKQLDELAGEVAGEAAPVDEVVERAE